MSQAPSTSQEIENKQNVSSVDDLKTIKDDLIESGLVDINFARQNPKPYFRKDQAFRGLLRTHPVSWYLDTKNFTMLENDATIRGRLTTYMDYIEFSIKGKGVPFVGAGGSLRHEGEKISPTFGFFAQDFQDHPTSQQLIRLIEGEELSPYFATDVQRDMVGIRTTTPNGKNSIFEIAFDPIKYIRHDPNSENGLSCFCEINQIEAEYFNPNSDPKFSEQLGLDHLTTDEVAIALADIVERIKAIAARNNLIMTPSDISKGRFGYEEMERQNLQPETNLRLTTDGGFYLKQNADILRFPSQNVA